MWREKRKTATEMGGLCEDRFDRIGRTVENERDGGGEGGDGSEIKSIMEVEDSDTLPEVKWQTEFQQHKTSSYSDLFKLFKKQQC